MQQTEVTGRAKASADRIRQGYGGYMVPTEKAVGQALDQVSKDLRAAQGALGQGSQGGQKGEGEQELRSGEDGLDLPLGRRDIVGEAFALERVVTRCFGGRGGNRRSGGGRVCHVSDAIMFGRAR